MTARRQRPRALARTAPLPPEVVHRLELASEFPKRRQLAKNSVAWLDTDIAEWAESRLVSRLRGRPRSTSGSLGAAYG
jgi:hypothetical protein